ncbi:hypothetical protein BYT27DRAFT_7193911 [Phlegmacium glaucopus]|nr:hypothetical protein BYT27DRAFT_7193911 [Phlegmacium glaucopus]
MESFASFSAIYFPWSPVCDWAARLYSSILDSGLSSDIPPAAFFLTRVKNESEKIVPDAMYGNFYVSGLAITNLNLSVHLAQQQ